MPNEQPTLTLKFEAVKPRDDLPFFTPDTAREQFWRSAVKIQNTREPESEIALCHDRLMARFGVALRDLMVAAESPRIETRDRVGRQNTVPLRHFKFRFRVLQVRYGSLELLLGVDGADQLAQAFAGNFAFFSRFLTQYAPQAFNEAVPLESVGPNSVTVSIIESENFAASVFPVSLAAPTIPASQGPSEKVDQKLLKDAASLASPHQTPKPKARIDLPWLVANFTMVVPVALSAIALYFGYKGLESERERLSQREKLIDSRDTAIRELMQAREKQVFEALRAATPASMPQTRQ